MFRFLAKMVVIAITTSYKAYSQNGTHILFIADVSKFNFSH